MMEPHAKRLCVGDAVLDLQISFMTGQSVRVRVQDNLFVSELQSAIGAAVGRACSNGKVFMNGRSEYLPSGGKLVELGVKDGDQLYMLEKPGELHMQVLCPQLAHSLVASANGFAHCGLGMKILGGGTTVERSAILSVQSWQLAVAANPVDGVEFFEFVPTGAKANAPLQVSKEGRAGASHTPAVSGHGRMCRCRSCICLGRCSGRYRCPCWR